MDSKPFITKSEGYDILKQFLRIRAELQTISPDVPDYDEIWKIMNTLYDTEHTVRYVIENFFSKD